MRYLIKLLKALPNIIRSIPAIMFVVSLTTADSENTGAAIAFILTSGAILYIQLKVLDLRYKKAHRPERQRCKDYSEDFAELCLKFEVIPPPKRNKQFRSAQSISYVINSNDEFEIKRIIGKKVLVNENV